MAIIRDEVLRKLLPASALKKIIVLSFIRSKKNGVTLQQIEEHYGNHPDGRPITRTGIGDKRVIDNTVRSIVESLVKEGFSPSK